MFRVLLVYFFLSLLQTATNWENPIWRIFCSLSFRELFACMVILPDFPAKTCQRMYVIRYNSLFLNRTNQRITAIHMYPGLSRLMFLRSRTASVMASVTASKLRGSTADEDKLVSLRLKWKYFTEGRKPERSLKEMSHKMLFLFFI
jgi:hypothetical protein